MLSVHACDQQTNDQHTLSYATSAEEDVRPAMVHHP